MDKDPFSWNKRIPITDLNDCIRCVATVAGMFALLFPETLGQRLPETIEESAE